MDVILGKHSTGSLLLFGVEFIMASLDYRPHATCFFPMWDEKNFMRCRNCRHSCIQRLLSNVTMALAMQRDTITFDSHLHYLVLVVVTTELAMESLVSYIDMSSVSIVAPVHVVGAPSMVNVLHLPHFLNFKNRFGPLIGWRAHF
jgi:hypothetical protein